MNFTNKHPDHATQLYTFGPSSWSVSRLIQLSKDLPVMDIPLAHISMYYTFETMKLREFAGHVIAVNNADMSYPIIMDEDGDIMDGRHRLMKAMINGDETIKAVRFETTPDPCEIRNE